MSIKGLSHIDKFVPSPEKPSRPVSPAGVGPSFLETLKQTVQVPVGKGFSDGLQSLKFSNHAVERMKSRHIHLSQADLQRLEDAVARAHKKGARDSLVLMDGSAFVVSVKNRTVVTVMDQNTMKNNVFTNIDSTILV